MWLNLSTLYAGPLGSFGPGVCEVPDAIAQGLLEAGVARPVVETRLKPAPSAESVSVETESLDSAPVASPRRGRGAGKSS